MSKKVMFKKVCIIGCGLIGSSIARAIKKNKLAGKVVSSNRSNSTNKKIIKLNIVDEASSDTRKIVKGSDLIIIASPLSSYKNVVLKIKNSLKNGAILTDVGSVKKKVIYLIEKNIPNNVSWISSHPIAGTEESGPESGFSKLFKNRWCILTPSRKSKNKDVKLLKNFWKKLGSVVDVMDANKHDYILAVTSHMPHLIAYNIVNTTLKIKNKKDRNIVKYSAGGLRDFTRIAASNPIMWRDIFIQNRENTSKMIDKFIANLKDLKKAIKSKNEKKLEKIFTETKKIRKEIIKAGQDINEPDFGRN
jgi:prephenate dehydrogenase